MKRGFRLSILLVFAFLPAQASASLSDINSKDSLLLSSLKNSDIKTLELIFKNPIEIDSKFGEERRTLLTYSIEYGQRESVIFLLTQGADIELEDDNKTPLMFAAKYGRPVIAEILIDNDARVNNINKDKSTAFHYAAKYNSIEVLKILSENEANINAADENNWTALDYAIINGKEEIRNYLEEIGCVLLKKEIPDYFDGPYIEIPAPGKLKIRYLVNDGTANESSETSKEIISKDPITIVAGLKKDKNTYYVESEPSVPLSRYAQPSKIFVLGDIHGQYERMIKMLKDGGVIDDDLHWIWGNGHLVFTGDIFDRGEGVTEALWQIYKLEREAELRGGKVHLLIGNHEAMILKNDIRYIANKYYCLTSNLNISYHSLFSDNTVLGNWLRTKNVAEIIGNTLFIHAGISPDLAELGLGLEEINNVFRDYLCNNIKPSQTDLVDFLKGSLGPIWYRGYIRASGRNKEISQDKLELVFSQYGVKQAVVGHTEVDLISPLKKRRIYPVNIPLADKKIEEQALLIKDNTFSRLTYKNGKTILSN